MGKLNNIEWRNIYYMLCYCVDELQYFDESLIDYENVSGTHELLAQLLMNSFGFLQSNGYMKKYRQKNIVTDKPYGIIDVANTVRQGLDNQGKLYCRVSELNINNRVNQIIKLAFNVLLDSNKLVEDKIQEKTCTQLYYCVNMLSGVDDIKLTEDILDDKIDIAEWYRPIFAVCKMILLDYLAFDKTGNTRLLELDNQDRLCYIWEKFLRSFIRQKHREFKVEKRTFHFNNSDYVTPDIIIIDDTNNRLLVVDAKWYESERYHNANLAELGQNCAVIQNEDHFGARYKVTGINIYASSNKKEVRKPRKLDKIDTLYTDSFVAVNTPIDDLENQILGVINKGFTLEDMLSNS